jgi:hypothetical protein
MARAMIVSMRERASVAGKSGVELIRHLYG